MLRTTRFQTVVSIVFAALLVSSAVASPALAAEDDDGFFDGLVDDDSDVSLTEKAGMYVTSATSWATRKRASVFSDSGNATRYADDFESEFDANNETIESYSSARLDATSDYDVFRVEFHDRDDNTVSRYVVADVSNGSWENARVVNQSEFDSLNRTQDHYVSLDWYQSKHAADELDAFVGDYATEDKDLTASYRAKMLAQYGAPDSDMWGNESETA